MKNQFYKGFANYIKNKLVKEDRYIITFNKLVNKAIIIDNCIYEKRMEKKRRY